MPKKLSCKPGFHTFFLLIAGTSSGAPAARLMKPEGQRDVQYVNFLALEGYSVQIVDGKHFNTPEGEFVELKSGAHYEILLKNSHPYGKVALL